MRRDEIAELHYICPISNLASITTHGILSHRAATAVAHESVANEQIQDRRARVVVPGGQRLHDYVNLYFNGRNPMMYTVVASKGPDGLCLLRISSDVLDIPGVVIADCNASSDYVRFADPTTGLDGINRDEVFARYWNHPDHYTKVRHKSRMCAEVLVPNKIEQSFILGAYAATSAALHLVNEASPSLDVTLDSDRFFR